MQQFLITHATSGATLYEGRFTDIKKALEAAVSEHVLLEGAMLKNMNLDHAELDGGLFKNAIFDHSSLYGANISEADLSGASLKDATLETACLCESYLLSTDFQGTSFGSTLVTDARIDGCAFSCPSAFSLPFRSARLGRNIFVTAQGNALPFTCAPLVLEGLPERIVFLDDDVLIGHRHYPRPRALNAMRDEIDALYGVLAAASG